VSIDGASCNFFPTLASKNIYAAILEVDGKGLCASLE
jgi:hypothetical protein